MTPFHLQIGWKRSKTMLWYSRRIRCIQPSYAIAYCHITRNTVPAGLDLPCVIIPALSNIPKNGICMATMNKAASGNSRFKVSVLVPVYNTPEKFLRQCLNSLVHQTLRELEIVAIDDGSTNEAPAILAEYAQKHPNMQIITKLNTGYGDSMNRGIAAAQGEYIGICEPDDFAGKRMFKTLYRLAKDNDCDIVKGNFREHTQGSWHDRTKDILFAFECNKVFNPADDPRILLVQPSIWAAIYRRSMLVENEIMFSPTPGASYQDASFGHQCWISAKRAMLIREGLLHYRIDNAASSSKETGKVFAVCDEYARSFEFLSKRGNDLQVFGPMLNVMRFGVYVWNYDRIANEYHLEFSQQWAKEMREAIDAGLLDRSALPGHYPAVLDLLLEDPQELCNRYPDEIPQLALL